MNPDPNQTDPSLVHAHATQHLVSVFEPLATGDRHLWLEVAVDLRAGLAVAAGLTPGYLDVGIDPTGMGYASSVVTLAHSFAAWPDDQALALLLNLLAAVYIVPELVETLETQPLPTIDLPALAEMPDMFPTVFDVIPVETEIADDFLTVYMNMELRE